MENITEPQTNKMSTCLIPIKDTVTPNSKHAGFKVLCLGRTLHSHRGGGEGWNQETH